MTRFVLVNKNQRRECSDPTRNTNAVTSDNEFGHGEKVTLKCRRNYVLVPSESRVITCNDGVWDKKIPSCKGILLSLITTGIFQCTP